MKALTEKEALVFHMIPEDDFYEDGLDSVLWTDVFVDFVYNSTTGLSPKAIGGVLSSLSRKGYIHLSGGKDGNIEYTKKCKVEMFGGNANV